MAGLQRRATGVTLAAAVGLVTFVLAYLLLPYLAAPSAAPASVAQPTPTLPSSGPARITPSHLAVGVPVAQDQAPLGELNTDDRVDVLAVLPDTPAGPGLAGSVVSGARVLETSTSGGTRVLLLDVAPDEAFALGHLVRRGVALTYTVWRDGAPGGAAAPLSGAEARARLGLPPVVAPSVPGAPVPPAPPAPIAAQAAPAAAPTPVAPVVSRPLASTAPSR